MISGWWNAGTSRDGTDVVDRELVLRKVAALEGYLAELDEFRDITVEAYRADWKKPGSSQTAGGVAAPASTPNGWFGSWRQNSGILADSSRPSSISCEQQHSFT